MSKIIKNGQIFGSTDDKDIKSTDYDGNSSKLNTVLSIIHTKIKSLSSNKVDKVSGKGLSTNDYTTTEKNNGTTYFIKDSES